MIDALTYVYCLVRSARRPSLRAVPAGMPGSLALRALDAGGRVWAIVTTVPAGDYGEAGLAAGLQDLKWVGDRAMAHESVVEHFLRAGTVLPMQLFTLFTSDERALEHIARDRPRIDRIVERIDGRLEWGVRLSFNPAAAAAAQTAGASRRAPGRAPADGTGTSYLTRKRDVLHATQLQLAEARTQADRVYAALAGAAAEARRRTAIEQAVPGSRVVLDAAFLVAVTRGTAFNKAVQQQTRPLAASGIEVSLTGPWPAYNFIDTAPAAGPPQGGRTPRRGARQSPKSAVAPPGRPPKRPIRRRI